ncbi:hypothetical protein K2173_023388 [Erythroxylum novogranatense]|uniref:Macro domain-containing protein n=1 Tax=Erythroxylum novogranatense TaxID=1862640 RepID=A0AAV8TZF2_9ROSI|nr:hypothetical protein K2173_023388 [Erythroxylum novogranatense]
MKMMSINGARTASSSRYLVAATATATRPRSNNSNINKGVGNLSKRSFGYYQRKPTIPYFLRLPTISSASSSSSSSSFIMSESASAGGSTQAVEDSSTFPLSTTTLLKINKGDITKWFIDGSSDAIVNPANERMLGGGGADGAIHTAAGPELRNACYDVPEVRPGVRCPTGEARITPGFKLPASHVIHTVGPVYDTDANPAFSLRNAYRNSLIVGKDNNIKYIAFPAISCGVYGYPFEEAATEAISAVKEFSDDFKEVHFVLFSDEIYSAWLKKANELLQA